VNAAASRIRAGRLERNIGFLAARFSWFASRRANAALAPFELTARPYAVLELATTEGGIAQRDLGRILSLDPSGVVAIVDGLSERRLVARRQDASDRRRSLVEASPAGRALAAEAARALERVHREMLAELTEVEPHEVERVLGALALRRWAV